MIDQQRFQRTIIALFAVLLGTCGVVTGQSCPDECSKDPKATDFGVVPPGVTVDVHFQSAESGTGVILYYPETGPVCPGCTPCTGVIFIDFDAGGTSGTVCYTPDGGGVYATVPEGERTTTTQTSCDGDPQLINVHFYANGVDCSIIGGGPSASHTTEVRLYCLCLDPPQ